MDEKKTKVTAAFYGGALGPWIPVIIMIVGMIIGTVIGGGGLTRFAIITFAALIAGFLLAKDKKNFGEICFSGLKNHMLSILIIAFLMAGVMGQLLRQSGLINALIYVVGELNMSVGLLPLIAFLICAVISTSCGTSTGSAAAVAPLLIPLSAELGCNVGLICGAIIAGAIFGDNLAPISDTTIGSALTQEAAVKDVVRTRLPYSLIAGGLSAVLFVIFGMRMDVNTTIHIGADETNLKALAMLILPILMIVLMKKGLDIVGTLIICNVVGVVLVLALGCIPLGTLLDNEGPIGAGLTGMMGIVLYALLIFQILEILNVSGAFDRLMAGLIKLCKTPRSGEFAGMAMTAVTTICAGGSSPAIIFCGPLVRNVAKNFGIEKTRGANILDGTSCGVSGLLPYGTCIMLCMNFTQGLVPEDFSFLDIIPYSFHSMFLLLLFFFSILTGIGRRFEKESK
ncbi:Na+/H+ antiporter NhaC family protein [Ihubacter sp. rT4E-8]|uniref:Na+/H+ antiporter NhaC family protein n=1 Tax=Ihubacter sp. rT4E-8 TaxID=3242369 RepID=UPI003CF40CBF